MDDWVDTPAEWSALVGSRSAGGGISASGLDGAKDIRARLAPARTHRREAAFRAIASARVEAVP